MQAALNRSDQLPRGVQVMLSGPSGAAQASDALWFQYTDLTREQSQRIRDAILESLTQRQGWSINSIVQRILPILESADLENPLARAEVIARTEVRSIASVFKMRRYLEDEAARGEPGVYRMRGAHDFRRTKLSWWIDQQVGEGKPLPELLRIMDDGIQRCKAGDFTLTGSLSATKGQPIKLPLNFYRRGFLCHYQDRDTVVEVIQ